MSDLSEKFSFVMSQLLIWRDMDAYQHINNAVYFRYFEDARMAIFEQTGASAFKDQTLIGPILASTRCDFRAPLTYPDRIQVGAAIEDIQAKRFTMKYAVWSEVQGRVAAEGEGVLVYYDYNANRSCQIPPQIRDELVKLRMRDG